MSKTVLITGGSRGLGADIALVFAKAGYHISFTFQKQHDRAVELQELIHTQNVECIYHQVDASSDSDAQIVCDKTIRKWGSLDVIICNAATTSGKLIYQMEEDEWDQVIAVNLKGAFNYIRAGSPYMINQKSGKIICITSINANRGRIGGSAYNCSKAGIHGLVKTAARELAKFDINVNAVAPGFIETEGQQQTSELIKDLVIKETPLNRLAKPQDISSVVYFLSSPKAKHITGQILEVDGGANI